MRSSRRSILEKFVDLITLHTTILADYLKKFFMGVMKADGSSYNASTLGAYHNALAKFFIEERKLDIKKETEFVRIEKIVARRQEESVKEGKIPGVNASKAIPKEVLAEVFMKGNIGMGNMKALTAYVIQCFEIGFGIRCQDEMYEIRNGDISESPNKVDGIPEYIELSKE